MPSTVSSTLSLARGHALRLTLLLSASLSVGCGAAPAPAPLSDAARYAGALSPDAPLTEALGLCAGLSGADAQGDCATAAMEARRSTSPEDCEGVVSGRWRDECWFLLAERVADEDQVSEAIELCARGRFSRECSFHLLRAQASAAVGEPAELAQRRLAPFDGRWPIPDAPALFWREWLRAGQRAGASVDPEACLPLPEPGACRGAAKLLWREALKALHHEALCAAFEEGRPPLQLAGGAPAFTLDEAMEQDIAGRCGAPARP